MTPWNGCSAWFPRAAGSIRHTARIWPFSQTMRIRDALVSDWYRRMFPDTQVRGNRQNFVTTAAGGELYGVGMTGTLTGFGAGRKRREFGGAIVIDDPLSAEESRSATRRAHVNEWYTQTLKSRRNHDGTPILLIMQRLHTEDLVGHVLATEPGLWRVLKLSAMDEATGEMLSARDVQPGVGGTHARSGPHDVLCAVPAGADDPRRGDDQERVVAVVRF